jgi:hypothetical protein
MFKKTLLSTALVCAFSPIAMAVDPLPPAPVNPDEFTTTYLESIPEQAFAWAQSGIKDYAFFFRRSCFCADSGVTYHINVRNHKIVAAYNAETGINISADRLKYYPTISELHVELLKQNNKAHIINVEYDANWHYPKSVFIDIHPMMADEEIAYEIEFFAPIIATAEPFSGTEED